MNKLNNKTKFSKKELFDKFSNIFPNKEEKVKFTQDEINYIKKKILNDKLGLVLNFEEKDEFLDEHYFGLEEIKELHINPKDKNNNLLIEGDNYYALKALKVSGIKVDVIYIDPPYNTGNKDFIYNDDYSDDNGKYYITGQYVEKDDRFKHSKWISFMKKRLELAKDLLADDGIIFVSIDDNEQAYLKVLMDEIFGEENFVANLIWYKNKSPANLSHFVRSATEYVLVFTKNKNNIQEKGGFVWENRKKESDFSLYNKTNTLKELEFDKNKCLFLIEDQIIEPQKFDTTELKTKIQIKNQKANKNFIISSNFSWTQEKLNKEFLKDSFNIIFRTNQMIPRGMDSGKYTNVRPLSLIGLEEDGVESTNKSSSILKSFELGSTFDYPKPSSLIKYLCKLFNKKNQVTLDFFAGSGTTAQAVMELNEEDGGNRRFILCTNNENNIAQDICRERIYRVINGKGSKGEQISWEYSKDKKSLSNNSMKYLRVKPINNVDGDYEEINDMKEIYKNEFDKELLVKDFR